MKRLLMPIRHVQLLLLAGLFAMTIIWELLVDVWDGPDKGVI